MVSDCTVDNRLLEDPVEWLLADWSGTQMSVPRNPIQAPDTRVSLDIHLVLVVATSDIVRQDIVRQDIVRQGMAVVPYWPLT